MNSSSSKTPIYKKWWFYLIIVAIILGGILSSLEDKDVKEDNENSDNTTQNENELSNKEGTKNNPYILIATNWYTDHCANFSSPKYIDQWVKVSGTVLSISDYGNLKGYYLSGGSGKGLVCWVEGDSVSAKYGQQIEYIGKVIVEDSKHIEISEGELKNVAWPESKPISPITISDWSWTRDYAGGVEWNFKFTNNTDKVVKYINIEWACYNAVGDLVYDEITNKCTHSVKYTGPLQAKETSILLRNTTLFYSYSYHSSKLTKLSVEFTDGTIIYITSQGYSNILAED